MENLVIRPAQAEDAKPIDALGYAAALHQHRADPLLLAPPRPGSCEWSEAALAAEGDALCLVATSRGEVIGYVHARVVVMDLAMFVPHTYGMIERLAVLPERRSQGVGTSLQVAAERWFAARGISTIRLSVFASNDAAVKLYARRGYVPVTLFMQRKIASDAHSERQPGGLG
jgi:ribosomal protein S18 acetylase RimI-like enzyme